MHRSKSAHENPHTSWAPGWENYAGYLAHPEYSTHTVSLKEKLMAPKGGHGSNTVETMILPLVEWFMPHAVR